MHVFHDIISLSWLSGCAIQEIGGVNPPPLRIIQTNFKKMVKLPNIHVHVGLKIIHPNRSQTPRTPPEDLFLDLRFMASRWY